jgi:hypothetical protein
MKLICSVALALAILIQPTISRADNNSMYGSYIDVEV